MEGNKGGESSHELRDHTKLDKVLSLNVRKQPEIKILNCDAKNEDSSEMPG